MAKILLTPSDYSAAMEMAKQRCIEALLSNRVDKVSSKDWYQDHEMHLKGAVGELALAKYLNLYPGYTLNNFHGMGSDVSGMEVRCRHRGNYDLIVRKDDDPNKIYVLVRGIPPEMEVVGWILGRDAMNDRFLEQHGGFGSAWFVPGSFLNPVESLVKK